MNKRTLGIYINPIGYEIYYRISLKTQDTDNTVIADNEINRFGEQPHRIYKQIKL